MTWFSKTAYKIRHSPWLKNSDRLWNTLRGPYHFFLDIRGNGVSLTVANILPIKVPALYYTEQLSNYEEETIGYLIEWLKKNPNAYFIDLGCSIGLLSTIALFASETCTVIGVDSDISSLKACRKMSKYSSGERLKLVYGLISDFSKCGQNIGQAIEHTEIAIMSSPATGNPGSTKYINLDGNPNGEIPQHSIDTLYKNYEISAPILIKCDIEGAELLALKGSKLFLRTYHPVLLLSVHPGILPIFNSTVQQLREFLEREGYNIEIISIDHEEHWWCNYKSDFLI